MQALIRQLRWSDLAGAAEPLNEVWVRRLTRGIVGGLPADDPVDRDAVERRLDTALVTALGPWVAGWNWAATEPGCGGPVREYCCADDSLLHGVDRVGATVDRVLAAVQDWRGFLHQLAHVFRELGKTTAAKPVEEAVEFAARTLLPLVLERTSAEDAWYATFARVLTWFLESNGHDPEDVASVVAGAISGHFRSWVEPDQGAIDTVCAELGQGMARVTEESAPEIDALALWLRLRERPIPTRFEDPMRVAVQVDAHAEFIARVDAMRGEERAWRMEGALRACREAASAGAPLSLDALSEWQALVLGVQEVPTRSGPAFAKGGRERYGWDACTITRFERCLKEANDAEVDPTARAARAYLDVCFFHPFEDGNARAARLALDFILTRAGLALHACEPLFVMSRSVTDETDTYLFWLVLDRITGPREPVEPTGS